MNEMYLYMCAVSSSVICPVIYWLESLSLSVNTDGLAGLDAVLPWLVLWRNTSVVPQHLSISFGVFIASFLISFIVRLLRFVSNILPGF
jgi:hypothetical protein